MSTRKWPEKFPEKPGEFSLMDTPLTTDAPAPDARPGINPSVDVKGTPANTIGYSGLEGGRKGRK